MGSCGASSEAASQKLDLLVIPVTIMINWEEFAEEVRGTKLVQTSFKKRY